MNERDEQEALRRHLSKLGEKGGPIGGKARMASLTGTERTALATKAAAARWGKKSRKKATKRKPNGVK